MLNCNKAYMQLMKSLPFGGFDLSPLLFILKSNCLLEFPTGTSNAGTLN